LSLETSNKSSTIILSNKLFKQERLKNYLKTKALSSKLLSIIDIIKKLARISKKLEIQVWSNRIYKTKDETIAF